MTGLTDFAVAAQALAASLLAATADPADSVRVLTNLADFSSAAATSSYGIGTARATMQSGVGDLFRRAALAALCRAATQYQPSSSDDALALRTAICALLDDEILIAGNEGADLTFNALRVLRSAVVQDLTQRGSGLAPLATVSSPSVVPAPVIAQRLYRDSTRSDELVIEANPRHPAFMPTSFTALSQ